MARRKLSYADLEASARESAEENLILQRACIALLYPSTHKDRTTIIHGSNEQLGRYRIFAGDPCSPTGGWVVVTNTFGNQSPGIPWAMGLEDFLLSNKARAPHGWLRLFNDESIVALTRWRGEQLNAERDKLGLARI